MTTYAAKAKHYDKVRAKAKREGICIVTATQRPREDSFDPFPFRDTPVPGACPDCKQMLDQPARPVAKVGRRGVWCATCEGLHPKAKP